jgi:hypothetical protein
MNCRRFIFTFSFKTRKKTLENVLINFSGQEKVQKKSFREQGQKG